VTLNFRILYLGPQLRSLIEQREHARKAGDFKRADRIREELRALGAEIQDSKI